MKVELYQLQNDGSQRIVATCQLHNGVVQCTGDPKLVAILTEEGIRNYSADGPKQLMVTDGQLFLQQLKYNFKSGYLNASDVLE